MPTEYKMSKKESEKQTGKGRDDVKDYITGAWPGEVERKIAEIREQDDEQYSKQSFINIEW